MTTLEKVARAICAEFGVNPDDVRKVGDETWRAWEEYLPIAKAADKAFEEQET